MIKRTLVVLCLISPFASGASFDCDKARSPLEKAVCTDPTLSALDSAMTQSYKTALQRLSPDGQKILRDGQRQWLGFVRDDCTVGPDAVKYGFCLMSLYKDRLKDLSNAAVSMGPYLFSRSDYFSASTRDENGQAYVIHTSAPRIDSPLSPAIEQWNSVMLNKAMSAINSGCDARRGDESFGFEVTYVSSRVITVKTTNSEYCHGTPHGQYWTVGVTYVVEPSLRPLEASDLFKMDSAWADFLTSRSYDVINKKAEGMTVLRGSVEAVATKVRNWTLTQDGLLITFDPYAVLSYAYGTTEVIVPWSDLKPFLEKNAPVPPQT